MTNEQIVVNKATLNEHVLIAVKVLTGKENNDPAQPLEEKTERYFMRWALSLRRDIAALVAETFPDFNSVVELIESASEEQKKGKTIRNILANEFNTAFKYSSEPGYMENDDYCALVTLLIFIVLAIDDNAKKRPEAISNANKLLNRIVALAPYDNEMTLHATICSEWFANYGEFRTLFQEELKKYRASLPQDLPFEVELETNSDPGKEKNRADSEPNHAITNNVKDNASTAQLSHQRRNTRTQEDTQQTEKIADQAQPSNNVVSLGELFAPFAGVGQAFEATQLIVNGSADKVFDLVQEFVNETNGELFQLDESETDPGRTVGFSIALRGTAGREYAKWSHFGHFYDSDQWLITVDADEKADDRTNVIIKAFGQGNLLDRVKNKNAGITLIEMSMYYAEKLIMQFAGSVRETKKQSTTRSVQENQPSASSYRTAPARRSEERRTPAQNTEEPMPVQTEGVLQRQFYSPDLIVHQDVYSGQSKVANDLLTWSLNLGGGAMDAIVVSYRKTPPEILGIVAGILDNAVFVNGNIGVTLNNGRYKIGEYKMIASDAHHFNAVIFCFAGTDSYNLNGRNDAALFNQAFEICSDLKSKVITDDVKANPFFATSDNGFCSLGFGKKGPIAQQVYDSTFWDNNEGALTTCADPPAWYDSIDVQPPKKRKR